jgi:hypothetical protein
MSDIADLVKPTGQPEAPDPGIGDLVAGPSSPEENNAGTRVDNPGTEAFAAGVLEGGGAAAGIYGGARLGQALGPYGMAAGAIGGAIIGSEAGQGLREAVGLRTPQQMAPDQRSLAEFTYSLGGGAAAAATPFGAAAVGLQLLERGVGKWLSGAMRSAQRNPKTFAAIEGSAVAGAAAGAYTAETLNPGDALTRFGGELAGGLFLDPLGRVVTVWNLGNKAFSTAMGKYGRNATEVQLGKDLVAAIKEAGDDPEQVIRVLEAGNPYGLTAAQLTADPVMMATERALAKKSDVFARSVHEKGVKAREAMTAQINILKLDGNPEHLGTIAALRKAQFDTIMEERVQIATARAKVVVERGVRKGLSDEALGDISARARAALDDELDRAEEYVGELYDKVSLTVPVRMDRTQQVIDEILERSADALKKEKIPSYLTDTLNAAKGKPSTTYDPESFVITEVPAGPATSDSRNLIDIRRKLLSDARAAEKDPEKAMQAGLNKRLQSAIMDDLDVAFTEGLDDSYDIARAANRAMKDVFERSFAGTARAVGKRGETIDPREMLQRAFATGKEAASLRLQDLDEATRFMTTRGMADEGATDVMLKAQEDALRLISTVSMKDGRINPATMDEYLRTNGALFNREPFISVRDDLREAIKSEEGLKRLEDFVKRRQNDIGKNSAFAKISGSNPVDYASRILVSSGDQETMFTKMFNMAKKGGTDRQGVQVVTPEQGVSSARASVLNAAFERSKQGSVFNLDTFRELLFVPKVSGQKSPITIMREQGVMTPEHVSNLSKLFNSLETLKIAERQGFGMDPKQSIGEIGLVLGAKIMASKAASALQAATGQSGASIIIAGAVAKAAETVVSKIPASRVQDVAILLMNDPKALAAVMRKETTAQGRMLQVQRFHSWLIQTGVTANRDFGPVEMFSQQEPQQ